MGDEIEKDIKALFDDIDKNNNGYIENAELKNTLVSIGINPSPNQLKDFIDQFDSNKDGKIHFDEFAKIFKDYILKEVLHSDDLLD
jgi:Ca2+-binding EF-hand superfamily protein